MNSIKQVAILFFAICCFTTTGNAQSLNGIETIAPFSDGLAAVKKGNTWGFINAEGSLVIDFRDDIVSAKEELPKFNNGLCLVKKVKEGITYYGYIDIKGNEVIPPEYLAATPFDQGFARVIKHYKQDLNATNALGKNIVKYTYNELIINTENDVVAQVRGPINLLFDRKSLQKNRPKVLSKFLSDQLVAVPDKDDTYTIYKLKQ